MPIIIVNFKSYEEAQAGKATTLAKACEEAAQSSGAEIIVVPAIVDLPAVRKSVQISVFSQHIDDIEEGAHTGHVTAASIKAHGAQGTLLNHSERPISAEHIQKAVRLCRENNLISVVCSPSLDMTEKVLRCAPDYIAYEPPELIGGNVSVTSAKAEVIRKAVEMVKEKNKEVKVLCGAGIKNGRDVQAALELGCAGVLVSSGIVKAENPKKALLELVRALQ